MVTKDVAGNFSNGQGQGGVNVEEPAEALPQAPAESAGSLQNPLLVDLLSRDGADFIHRCCQLTLGRDADPSALALHSALLQGHVDKLTIARFFAACDEARALSKENGGPSDVGQSDGSHLASLAQLIEHIELVQAKNSKVVKPPGAANVVIHRVPGLVAKRAQADVLTERRFGTLWLDMSMSLHWTGGVVGIVRTELEMACGLRKIDPNVRFSIQVEDGFAEIDASELRWLLDEPNVVDSYMKFFARYKKDSAATPGQIHVNYPIDSEGLYHPFEEGDIVLAVGWMDSQKEHLFSRIKTVLPGLYISYLIYDIILLLDCTRHFYDKNGNDRFSRYIEWISKNADYVLFGGETAKKDTTALQIESGWPRPPGRAVRFGTDIMKLVDPGEHARLLAEVGVTGPYIITVGSLEPRKNHDTLYRAYAMALQMDPENLPQLVICGKVAWRVSDLVDTMDRDPRLKGKLIRVTPTDAQLAALYANCLFTVLPSLYEGWSLTLPESLGAGKFCVTCDTPPLREIGGDLVDYVEPFDVRSWAEKILFYAKHRELLKTREELIAQNWPRMRWQDTAVAIYDALVDFTSTTAPKSRRLSSADRSEEPTIWMDLSLTYLNWAGGVNGIVRAELTLAHYLKKLRPDSRYFAYVDGYFFEIDAGSLEWLLNTHDISFGYQSFLNFWRSHEAAGTGHRNPFHFAGRPQASHPAYLPEFPDNSVVFFAGIDSDGTGQVHRIAEVFDLINPRFAVTTTQLIYDFTPILYPQFHSEPTCVGYAPFFEFVSERFDHLVYGGRTAELDGLRIQSELGLRSPPSDFIQFGSDIAVSGASLNVSAERDAEVLAYYGVTGDFVMTVGTIQPRKNHEMLYKAYLRILERDQLKAPLQLVIAGRPGWKNEDFLAIVNADSRVAGKILILHLRDDELDVFYRHCLFTLLPTFYEGWSLTLPESLGYGKFCIASDVEPLRETGGDLVGYIDPLDTYAWAKWIEYYANSPDDVANWEAIIAQGWHPTNWKQTTERLIEILDSAHRATVERIEKSDLEDRE